MPSDKLTVQHFLVRAALPVLCSVAVGFLFYQDEIFQPRHTSFQFLWTGIVASVLYYLMESVRSRDVVLGFLFLLMLTFVTTGSTQPVFLLRDVLYVGSIGATMFIYNRYFSRISHPSYAYPAFMLAGTYGILYLASSLINIWILKTFAIEHAGGDNVPAVATITAFFGLLIGFAVGTGIGLNERIAQSKERLTTATP